MSLPQRLLTPQQVADVLGVSVDTVRRIPVRKLPFVVVGVRSRRYTQEDVQRYITQNKHVVLQFPERGVA